MSDGRQDMSFVTSGFFNWNDGSRKMKKHQASISHHESISALERHRSGRVDELLNKNVAQAKADGHDMLWYVIEAIRHLTRQGLPLRGSYDSNPDHPAETNSNLWQQLVSYQKMSPRLVKLINRTHTYTSPEVQNELIEIMATMIQREVIGEIRSAKFYALMLDETPDVSGKEQLVICFQ